MSLWLVNMACRANLASLHAHFGEAIFAEAAHQDLYDLFVYDQSNLVDASVLPSPRLRLPATEEECFRYILQVGHSTHQAGAA
jgi:hypothetical protein